MLLSDEEVQERISSPLNLMNRLRNVEKAYSPSLPPPTADLLIPDLNEKLDEKNNDVKKQASRIMGLALAELEQRIPEVQKPEKLAQIAAEMNKVLVAHDKKDDEDKRPQVIVYAPQLVEENHFETIHVKEDAK